MDKEIKTSLGVTPQARPTSVTGFTTIPSIPARQRRAKDRYLPETYKRNKRKQIEKDLQRSLQKRGGTHQDAEGVMIVELAAALQIVRRQHEGEHPPHEPLNGDGRKWSKRDSKQQFGFIHWLATEMKVSDRRIYTLLNPAKQSFVGISTVDQVVHALGTEHWLADGTLHVVPNPQWTQERWYAWMKARGCCFGSETD